ncbi:hypothetical protein PHYC_00779 [Phycisphaerales bacterium]|nr:hypothetical protein PHYC_00779 [Phycisphaerales bacterium]
MGVPIARGGGELQTASMRLARRIREDDMNRIFGGVVVLGLCAIAGCQQYVSSPGVPTARGIPENPNKPAAVSCMVEAVRYVATRYPPGDFNYEARSAKEQGALEVPYAMVVNPPRGLRQSFYKRLVREIGPRCEPIAPANEAGPNPVFHISRVWMRFDSATVDVLRPMPEVGPGADGKPVYQMVTVRLEGGVEPWRVIHARAWAPEGVEIPAGYPMPDVERVDQFRWQMEEDQRNPPDRRAY